MRASLDPPLTPCATLHSIHRTLHSKDPRPNAERKRANNNHASPTCNTLSVSSSPNGDLPLAYKIHLHLMYTIHEIQMIHMIHVMCLVNFAQYCSKNTLPVINALPDINAMPDIRRTATMALNIKDPPPQSCATLHSIHRTLHTKDPRPKRRA